MLCHLQTAAKLCCKIRKIVLIECNCVIYMMITCNQCIVSYMAKYIICVWLNLGNALIPRCFAVATHNRKKSASRSTAPACCRAKRQIKADLSCHCCKCAHMLLTLFSIVSANMTILIFNLHANHRAAILIQKAFCLLINLLPKASHICKICRIIAS